jgi:hypothetical protein
MHILRGQHFVIDKEITGAGLRQAREHKPAAQSVETRSETMNGGRTHQAESAMIVGRRECCTTSPPPSKF